MRTHGKIFMQSLLCILLIAFCLVLEYRKSNNISQAGAFGFTQKSNDTFSHLAHNLYDGVCHEQP